jgi:hypothetical protein
MARKKKIIEADALPEPEGETVYWYDMIYAPQTGEEVLLWNGKIIQVGSYAPTVNQWYLAGQGTIVKPIYWMPFPLPPA